MGAGVARRLGHIASMKVENITWRNDPVRFAEGNTIIVSVVEPKTPLFRH